MGKQAVIKRLACEYCGKEYRDNWHLNQHTLSHTGEKPFKCDQCEWGFPNSSSLKRHVEKVHNKDLPFHCDFSGCGAKFSKEWELRHHSTVHTNKKPCPCTVEGCEASFEFPSKLKVHMDTVHATEKTQVCGYSGCSESFVKLIELQKHIRIAHPTQHICSKCNKEFRNSQNLKKHMVVHAIDRPLFTCTYDNCGKSFTKKYNLSTHIRIVHEQAGVRYFCSHPGCDKSYSREAVLKRHIKKHLENKEEAEVEDDVMEEEVEQEEEEEEEEVKSTKSRGGRYLDVSSALGVHNMSIFQESNK